MSSSLLKNTVLRYNEVSPVTFGPTVVLVLVGAILVNYAVAVSRYHKARKSLDNGIVPPTYPALIPFVGSVLPFAINTPEFVRRVTSYNGEVTSTAVSYFGAKAYLLQDRETIKKFMKHPSLSSPIEIYVYALEKFFGMPESALNAYRADDSGPHSKPIPGSNTQFRIDHLLHQNFTRAWIGPGLNTTTQRFRQVLRSKVDELELSSDSWTEVPDFYKFFLQLVSASITEAVFGPALLKLNKNFINDLWGYDDNLPWMSRGVPRFVKSAPFDYRDSLREQIKTWHSHARAHFREEAVNKDGSDEFWGSELVRHLQKVLTNAGTHDEEALASHHLGMVFASNFNLVPSALMTTLHTVQNPDLAKRVREEVEADFSRESLRDGVIDTKKLLKLPLLSSIYAETLRLHVKVFFFASSPHQDAYLGKFRLPRDALGVVNTDIPHMDQGIWNTKNGEYPVDKFWPERFLVDPQDPSSGPIKPELRKPTKAAEEEQEEPTTPYFSTDGLEGSWVPYGGGPAICPGRFLAKNIIMYTCALLATEFDFDFKADADTETLDYWRYGLGVVRTKNQHVVRIKRRTQVAA